MSFNFFRAIVFTLFAIILWVSLPFGGVGSWTMAQTFLGALVLTLWALGGLVRHSAMRKKWDRPGDSIANVLFALGGICLGITYLIWPNPIYSPALAFDLGLVFIAASVAYLLLTWLRARQKTHP